MEIKVKRIGFSFGTVGWLSKGITDGSIQFTESFAKDGNNHGLWLKYSEAGLKKSMVLAMRNPFDNTSADGSGVCSYVVFDRADGWSAGDKIGCTPACFDTLQKIGSLWVEQQEVERVADQSPAEVTVIID